jgi:DNA mismatch repair ATPase MutL
VELRIAGGEPRTCPHGRPLLVHLPPAELAQRFGRRG